ncbi:glycosyltransferase family 2 protein [Marinibactrum halimedae]|uniref:Glycosyltransferase 2-like domain-containing protein n=1 Tax=Marinibactrum halimedae TaxID=1444977 RepID=A0AA37WNJ7_9GAMM|nr:glycosyltransferase [Marinibactrum halimedae]MCD9458036.1 glycosyltransferase [Marinibactrum halimedae]GLS27663.1 hypothetical protein GCM10007877_33820 [Marinibactrum halimedae]
MPRVSVILPTYNDLDYLKSAIPTALNQIYQDFELIVVDDGSNDGTGDWIKTIDDDKLTYYYQENRGAANAINFALQHCSGELITYISSDNTSPEYFLEALVAAIDSDKDAKWAYASYFNIDADHKHLSINFNNHQLPNEMLTCSHRGNAAFMYERSCHDTVGPFIEENFCDTDMWIKLSSLYKAVYILEPLYNYRIHDNRISSTFNNKVYQEMMVRKWEEFEALHGSENVLRKIYPFSLASGNPDMVAMACNDIAIRYANQVMLVYAMIFWRVGLANGKFASCKALIHNVAEATGRYKLNIEEVKKTLREGLNKNKNLNSTSTEELMRRYEIGTQQAVEEGFCGYISDEVLLRKEYALRFSCFSYTAWKHGHQDHAVAYACPVRP